jgi:mono/diheme cytochrome c family protein
MQRITPLLLLCLAPLAAGAGDIFNGRELYQQHCVRCHGPQGEGGELSTPSFRQNPNLLVTDPQLLDTLRFGRQVMPGYQGILSEEEMYDLLSYVRTLSY